MLLKMKTLFLVASILIGFTAQAQNRLVEAGSYELKSGPKNLCNSFPISKRDLDGKSITISGSYTYQYQNSVSVLESDIDPDCEFREENQRSGNASTELTLTRTNEEVCSGKLHSRTVSTLTLRPGEIKVVHATEGDAPYTCEWKKK